MRGDMIVICCSKCFEKIIENDSIKSALLWIEMCKFYLQFKGTFLLREEKVPMYFKNFKYLEENGYVSSCDGENSVMIKMNGIESHIANQNSSYEEFKYICIDPENHSDSWE
jgi:hypothetical protein